MKDILIFLATTFFIFLAVGFVITAIKKTVKDLFDDDYTPFN